MADLGSTTVWGDLRVTGQIIGKGMGGEGGIVLTAEDLGGTNELNGTVSGMSLLKTSSTTAVVPLATIEIDDLQYGIYSIMLRIYLTSIANTANLIRIRTFHKVGTTETLLNTSHIKPSDGTTAATWHNFGMVTDFKGNSGGRSPQLKIIIDCIANPVAQNIYIDYVRISPAYTSIYSLPTT